MSYGVMPYRIHWKLLKGLWGDSKREWLVPLSEALTPHAEARGVFDSDFVEYLAAIADGNAELPYKYKYYYALEMVFQYRGVGTLLDNSEWYPSNKFSFELIPVQFQETLMPLPYPDDFPVVVFISPDNVIKAKEALLNDATLKEEVGVDAFEQLIGWYDEAADYYQGLAFYTY
uniref:DUF7691 family protein n=1 Tax=Thaumasiovibrio occultus TaxID=1891184 RepID=UPI000B35831B|nr:hypothetical protein [Thaumasiovibrio occultus]